MDTDYFFTLRPQYHDVHWRLLPMVLIYMTHTFLTLASQIDFQTHWQVISFAAQSLVPMCMKIIL